MVICCLSDTQANVYKTKEYINSFKYILDKADLIIHLGDGIFSVEKYLADYKKVVYLKGNHDKECDDYLSFYNLDISNIKAIFFHGQRANRLAEKFDIWKNKIRFKFGYKVDLSDYYKWLAKYCGDKFNLVVYGHIHVSRIEKINNTYYFCPGCFPAKDFLMSQQASIGVINIDESVGKIELEIIGYNKSTKETFVVDHKFVGV